MEFPNVAFIISITSITVGWITAIVSYYFTKKREKEKELRLKKLEVYAGILIGKSMMDLVRYQTISEEGVRIFARSLNEATIFGSFGVLKALVEVRPHWFQSESKEAGDRIHTLIEEMIKDINPKTFKNLKGSKNIRLRFYALREEAKAALGT